MTKTKTKDAPSVTGVLPLYIDARPVLAATHGDHAIRDVPVNYAFAANAPLIPITVDEFAAASLDYPIVLVGPANAAFVVTGLAPDQNLFVDADGQYAPDAYVPAYLRRYPFVFARDEGDTLRILCLDESSPQVGTTKDEGARALFEGEGAATDLTKQAMTFCQAFEDAERRTTLLGELLTAHSLLDGRQAHHNQGETSTLLIDYRAIDPAKVDALGDDAFLDLRHKGALIPLFAMLASAQNWQKLAVRDRLERNVGVPESRESDAHAQRTRSAVATSSQ